MRESFRLLPADELIAALMDFFFTRPFTRFPMVDESDEAAMLNPESEQATL
jgi:hypothetical protein